MNRCMLVFLLLLPALAWAQDELPNCGGCTLGIYDDPELTRNYGFPSVPLKRVWVGIRHESHAETTGFTTVEFSIDGFPEGDVIYTAIDATVTLGNDIRTPTDEAHGTGGVSIAWSGCQVGNRALVAIYIFQTEPTWPPFVLRVRRRFPPNAPDFSVPLLTQCDGPTFTKTAVTAGCYALLGSHYSHPPPGSNGCDLVSVSPSTWSGVKSLYRR